MAARLAKMTGLKPERADECMVQFDGAFPHALASVVQSRKQLPADYFATGDAIAANSDAINDVLEKLYVTVNAGKSANGGDEGNAWAADRAVEAAAASAPKKERFDGAFLDMPNFWKEEVEAKSTLFVMDRGFMAKNPKEALRARMLPWLDNCDLYRAPLKWHEIEDPDEEIVRVIIKDSVRTFFAEEHRQKLTEFLYCVRKEFGNYGQAMAYLAAVLNLALTEAETVAILRKCNKEYISGHWEAEAVGFATNAWVIDKIMHKTHPDVAKHFEAHNFWPDTYMQKILSGLGIHQLPYDVMFHFLDNFFKEGFMWLVKFELAIVEHFRGDLLKLTPNNINELYEMMRLDPKIYDKTVPQAVIKRAQQMADPVSAKDIPLLRAEMYDNKVGPRIKRAPKEPTFEPCEICDKAKPVWFCDDCGAICEKCLTEKCHKSSHEVEKY